MYDQGWAENREITDRQIIKKVAMFVIGAAITIAFSAEIVWVVLNWIF